MNDRDRAIEVCYTAATSLRNAGMTTTSEPPAGRHARTEGVSLPAEHRRQLLALASRADALLAVLLDGAVSELVAEIGGS